MAGRSAFNPQHDYENLSAAHSGVNKRRSRQDLQESGGRPIPNARPFRSNAAAVYMSESCPVYANSGQDQTYENQAAMSYHPSATTVSAASDDSDTSHAKKVELLVSGLRETNAVVTDTVISYLRRISSSADIQLGRSPPDGLHGCLFITVPNENSKTKDFARFAIYQVLGTLFVGKKYLGCLLFKYFAQFD